MPPGSHDAFVDQSNYANQIFRRYSDTIAAQFYGHTHSDTFAVGYSDYSHRTAATADGVAFIGGSLTPKSGNPVFRIYDVDPDTYEVMDFRTYTSEFIEPSGIFGVKEIAALLPSQRRRTGVPARPIVDRVLLCAWQLLRKPDSVMAGKRPAQRDFLAPCD